MKAEDGVQAEIQSRKQGGSITSVGTPIGVGTTVEPLQESGEAPVRSQWQLIRRRFLKHKLAVASLVLLVLMFLVVLFAGQISPYELNPRLTGEVLADSLQPPSAKHWFGTDELGRDQLTRIIHAGRISLLAGVAVALFAAILGTAVGALAGYYGGWVDQLLMRITDLVLVLPALAVLMIASQALGNSMRSTVIILAALFWMPVARVVRGLFLSLKEKEFVEAARASGAKNGRIIVRHMLPNTLGPILVNTTLNVGLAILTESTLSFLGFGVQPPTVSWGNMLAQSTQFVGADQSYLIWFPGLAILLTVLAVNFVGDGLRDALDPSSRH
jgi:peptide/nickel transport system permease protein